MKVLLDTNVVLDYLGANKNFTDEAEKVFNLAEIRRAVKDRTLVKRKYEILRAKINILPVTENDSNKK